MLKIFSRLYFFFDAARIYRTFPRSLRVGFWFILFIQTVTAILESSTIIILTFFIGSVSAPDSMRQGAIMQRIFSLLPEYYVERLQGDRYFACAMCVVVVLFVVLKNVMTGFSLSRTTAFAERLGMHVNQEVFSRFFYKDYLWHISPVSGDVLIRIGYCGHLTNFTCSILQLFGYAICCLFMTASLFIFEPYLTVILAGTFGIVSYITYKRIRLRIDYAGNAIKRIAAMESWSVNMATRGIREVIIYRKQEAFLKSIIGAVREGMPYRSFLAYAGSLPSWLLEVSGFTVILGVMAVLAYLGRPMHEIIASVSMLFLSTWRLLPSVSRCMGLIVNIRGLRALALSCLDLLEGFALDNPELTTAPDPDFRFNRDLALNSVSFRYPLAHADCLHGITLGIAKGESIGLIGPSGSGKSTLAMILAGLLDPASGAFVVDGVPLEGSRKAAYRQTIGFVPQTPLLFPGTIADNVALSKWGEEYSREDVEAACRMAAMDFLESDPRGVDFPIGDGGQGLSGGQAQRVSIARALFTRPDILILDEATSSLDQSSENAIASTIGRLKGQILTIIIAHRLTTVEQCDRLVWLDEGRIVRVGPVAEILPAYIASMHVEPEPAFEELCFTDSVL